MTDPIKPELDDAALDSLFAEARADAVPSTELSDRIIADAIAQAEVAQAVVVEPSESLWSRMIEAIGGWPSVSGLATAAVAGVYIGFSDPTLLETVGLSEITEDATAELLLGDDAFFEDTVLDEG